jgi:hypothetical protein
MTTYIWCPSWWSCSCRHPRRCGQCRCTPRSQPWSPSGELDSGANVIKLLVLCTWLSGRISWSVFPAKPIHIWGKGQEPTDVQYSGLVDMCSITMYYLSLIGVQVREVGFKSRCFIDSRSSLHLQNSNHKTKKLIWTDKLECFPPQTFSELSTIWGVRLRAYLWMCRILD